MLISIVVSDAAPELNEHVSYSALNIDLCSLSAASNEL